MLKELIKKIGGPNRNSHSAQTRSGSLEREMQIFWNFYNEDKPVTRDTGKNLNGYDHGRWMNLTL